VVAVASANQPWLGKWVLSDKPALNWEPFVAQLHLANPLKDVLFETKKTENTITRVGDEYTSTLLVPETGRTLSSTFKIGESKSLEHPTDLPGHKLDFIAREDGGKLTFDVTIPTLDGARPIEVSIEVVGDELVKTFKVGDSTATRYFNRG